MTLFLNFPKSPRLSKPRKVVRSSILFVVFFMLIASHLPAQNGISLVAWLDTQFIDNKQIIRGWCQNNGSATALLNYHAEYNSGAEKIIRKGSVLASPLRPILLTNAVFVTQPGSMDSVKLLLFLKNKQVFSTQIVGRLTQAIQELPPPQIADLSPPPAPAIPSTGDVEIDGLVLDDTRSKLAHDFYELFYSGWSAAGVPSLGKTIVIRELPARIGIGTSVIVEVDDRQITTLNLQPRAELLELLANQLVEALSAHIQDPNNFQEIDSGDLNGSGIY